MIFFQFSYNFEILVFDYLLLLNYSYVTVLSIIRNLVKSNVGSESNESNEVSCYENISEIHESLRNKKEEMEMYQNSDKIHGDKKK